MRTLSKRIAFLCMLLTLWSVYAFAAHHHSSSIEAAKCTVCVAAHSASPVSVSKLLNTAPVPVSRMVAAVPVAAKQRLIAFALAVRPPPAV
jgi:hypothetical protein